MSAVKCNCDFLPSGGMAWNPKCPIHGKRGTHSLQRHGSAIYRDMWAVVFPDGHIVTGSDLQTEADAWRIALGWPGPEEIDDAMKRGAFAVKARLRYYSPNNPAHRPARTEKD